MNQRLTKRVFSDKDMELLSSVVQDALRYELLRGFTSEVMYDIIKIFQRLRTLNEFKSRSLTWGDVMQCAFMSPLGVEPIFNGFKRLQARDSSETVVQACKFWAQLVSSNTAIARAIQ